MAQSKKTIAIFGASGFLGSSIVLALNQSNCRLKLFSRNKEKIKYWTVNPDIQIFDFDLDNLTQVKKDLKNIIYADSITTREMWDAINQTDDIITAKAALRKKLEAKGLSKDEIERQLQSSIIYANSIKDTNTDENFYKKNEGNKYFMDKKYV